MQVDYGNSIEKPYLPCDYPFLCTGNKMIKVEIIKVRGKRKYMVLRLKSDGTFSLRVSSHVTGSEIDTFLDKNASWMRKTKEKFDKAIELRKNVRFEDGEKHLLFGKEYEIKLVKDKKCLSFDGFFNLSENCKDNARKVFRHFYRNILQSYLDERLTVFSSRMNCTYSTFSVGSATKTWGSCRNKTVLRFTLLLAMAPVEVIDYVIIHELVHTKIAAHGKLFWNEVEKIMPNWKEMRKWLMEKRDLLLSYV